MTVHGVRVAVLGEALIDVLPDGMDGVVARPGGSPANVAIGTARLGVPTAFLGRTSTDRWGGVLRDHLGRAGVRTDHAPLGPEPTAIALVDVQDGGEPVYRFLWAGTADRALTIEELPDDLGEVQVLHVGSVACLLEPGATAIRGLVDRERDDRIVTFDPNVRTEATGSGEEVRAGLLDLARQAHVVKASVQDLAFLVPDADPRDVAHDLAARDVSLVVITAGPGDVRLVGQRAEVVLPVPPMPVADTVGAGDAFMAGLVAGLLEAGLDTSNKVHTAGPEALRAAGALAVRAACVAVSRVGADPPTRADLDQAP